MGVKQRGFGSIQDPERRKVIASQASRIAHEKGVAHQWTSEEARDASAKGLETRRANKIKRALRAEEE